ILPVGLNKGMAVKRLKERISFDCVICGGDSELDLSMLQMADIAIIPRTLRLQHENIHILPVENYACELLKIVRRYRHLCRVTKHAQLS
ncbi:MAG: hypothetical protein LBP21_08770, partial [Synergistaceae bacterium]|nr:hypothetical protein [Synergistaceae bacterium]